MSKGYCPVCGGRFTVTAAGEMRAHGPANRRCPGSGSDPAPFFVVPEEDNR